MAEAFRKPFTAPPVIFLVALLLGIGLGWVYPWAGLSTPGQIVIGLGLIGLGIGAIAASIRAIAAGGTTYDPFAASTALVTSGIYALSRNPGYLGLALIQFGLAALLDNLWIAVTGIAAIAVTSAFVIRLEEEKLTAAFGEDYLRYKAAVRRWI